MQEFINKNGWSIVIGVITMLVTFSSTSTLYGYRISELEKKISDAQIKIDTLTQTNVQTLVSIARIETDIAYIKVQVDKIVK